MKKYGSSIGESICKVDVVLLKCIFLNHRWGANLTKHLKSFQIIQYLKNKKKSKIKNKSKKKIYIIGKMVQKGPKWQKDPTK